MAFKVKSPLGCGGGSAFRGKALWESLCVCAVIVDHVDRNHDLRSGNKS